MAYLLTLLTDIKNAAIALLIVFVVILSVKVVVLQVRADGLAMEIAVLETEKRQAKVKLDEAEMRAATYRARFEETTRQILANPAPVDPEALRKWLLAMGKRIEGNR